MTPRQLRSKLQGRLLSTVPQQEAVSLIEELERIQHEQSQELGVDLAPAHSWISDTKDTLVVTADGVLLAALVIQKIPFLDPLVLRPNMPWPALVLEFTRLRAEGVLLAHRHDEYRVAVPRGLLDKWEQYLFDSSPETQEAVGPDLLVFRREL